MPRLAPLAAALAALAAACGGSGDSREMSASEVAAELERMRIEPGRWLLTSTVEDVRAPGLPIELRNRMLGERTRLVHCILPAQAAHPGAHFLALREDRGCVYRGIRFEDGRLRGRMQCPGAIASMDGQYRPRVYDLKLQVSSPVAGGGNMVLDVRSRGRRVGACR
ncbi:MAG: DUF3617 domain-containing protein [Sphingosinicella sp.]